MCHVSKLNRDVITHTLNKTNGSSGPGNLWTCKYVVNMTITLILELDPWISSGASEPRVTEELKLFNIPIHTGDKPGRDPTEIPLCNNLADCSLAWPSWHKPVVTRGSEK